MRYLQGIESLLSWWSCPGIEWELAHQIRRECSPFLKMEGFGKLVGIDAQVGPLPQHIGEHMWGLLEAHQGVIPPRVNMGQGIGEDGEDM